MTVKPSPLSLSIGQCASLACLLEVAAPKPGNVHRGADFDYFNFVDFGVSSVAIAPALAACESGARLGESVLAAVRATRQAVATNTNLGTVLLLVPLAMVPREQPLAVGVRKVLTQLDAQDAAGVYAAIREANPGGMGQVPEADLADAPPADLLHAMRLAQDRDLVARQYVNGFAQVLDAAVPWLAEGIAAGWPLGEAIVHVQMRLMSEFPDTQISRKCGLELAEHSAALATSVLRCGGPGDEDYHEALADFDFWLRTDGHRRNPGTTADLIAAGLFAALRDGIIQFPFRFYR